MQLFHGEVPFSKAKDLGIFLEIRPAILEDLIFIQKDVQGMMTAVVSHWLEHGNDRSWSKLAEAVEYCGYKVMAEKIRKKHAILGDPDAKLPSTCKSIEVYLKTTNTCYVTHN